MTARHTPPRLVLDRPVPLGRAVCVLGAAIALAALPGCKELADTTASNGDSVSGGQLDNGTVGSGSVTTETHAYQVTEAISAINVRAVGGSIEVHAGSRDTTRVTETLHYNGDRPDIEHPVRDGELELLGPRCSFRERCWVDYRVEVPAGIAEKLMSVGGDVDVHGPAGQLKMTTTGGSVRADGIASKEVTAKGNGGSVDLRFAEVPDEVDATGNGTEVTVRLPDAAYAVKASALGGRRQVDVTVDDASPHVIEARSVGGEVAILRAG